MEYLIYTASNAQVQAEGVQYSARKKKAYTEICVAFNQLEWMVTSIIMLTLYLKVPIQNGHYIYNRPS